MKKSYKQMRDSWRSASLTRYPLLTNSSKQVFAWLEDTVAIGIMIPSHQALQPFSICRNFTGSLS